MLLNMEEICDEENERNSPNDKKRKEGAHRSDEENWNIPSRLPLASLSRLPFTSLVSLSPSRPEYQQLTKNLNISKSKQHYTQINIY